MISFQDLSLFQGKDKWRRQIENTENNENKYFLNSISGKLESLSLIMGPRNERVSLMKCLSGLERNFTGKIIIANSKEVDHSTLRQLTTYIPSNPILSEDMRINDLIDMRISLGNPSISTKKKNELLEIFSSLPYKERVSLLSEGDRRRLSTLLELLTEVPILFIEDCTDGMDVYEGFKYIKALKNIAKTYFITISVSINRAIDEYIMEFDNVFIIGEDGKLIDGGMIKKTSIDDIEKSSMDNITKTTKIEEYPTYKKYKAPFGKQFLILINRFSYLTILNPWMHLRYLLKSIFFGVLLGLVYLDSTDLTPYAQVYHKTSALIFFSFNNFFSSCLGTIPSMVMGKKIYYDEISKNIYDLKTYYLVKVSLLFPFAFFYPYLAFLIAYYMIGLNSPFSVYLFSATFIAVGSLCGSALTLVIAGGIDSLAIILIIASLILMLLFIVTGLFSHISTQPAWFSWIRYISPIYYTFAGLIQNQFQGQNIPNCDPDIYGSECDGDDYLQEIEFNDLLPTGVNLTLEIVLWLMLLLLGFLMMWIKLKNINGF